MLDSINATSDTNILEVLIGCDTNDTTDYETLVSQYPYVKLYRLEQSIRTSDYHNFLGQQAKYDIILYCGDDIVFEKSGWEARVQNHFNQYEDKILLLYCPDITKQHLATHGFVSKKSTEILGYLLSRHFRRWYHDTWMTEIYSTIGRIVRDEELGINHKHHLYNNKLYDATYSLQYTPDITGKRPIDYDAIMWGLTTHERLLDANKLKNFMK